MSLSRIALGLVPWCALATASAQSNPNLHAPGVSAPSSPTSGGGPTATLTGYTHLPTWRIAAGGPFTELDFDSLPDATLVTGTGALLPWGIVDSFGTSLYASGPVDQYVYCSCNMPFDIFVPGTLPSEPNYFANDRETPIGSSGTLDVVFASPRTACGAFVADAAPLGNFTIEVFAPGGARLGSINVPPRTLPHSFVGIVSTQVFVRAEFRADDVNDCWGLDDLQHVGGPGTTFCTATPNSSGSPASIWSSGTASVAAGDLTLHAAPVSSQPGLFFHGANQALLPFGNGFRCTSGGITRGAPQNASGHASAYTYDNSDAKHELSAFVGTTRHFQYWFRDPLGGGAHFNTSDAISIEILP